MLLVNNAETLSGDSDVSMRENLLTNCWLCFVNALPEE